INYNKQMDLIRDLSAQKKALFCFPSKESKVTRLGGSRQQLQELFDLGYSDMENRKQSLFDLLND
ncbi:MAG: patatin family protein, partial [Erysipelotrichaceae bacterium]|nr:patatin family protein [Erysipelotrichaceae bacterium]